MRPVDDVAQVRAAKIIHLGNPRSGARDGAASPMDRHAATRRLKHLAATAGIRKPRMHPHMLRHTFVTTIPDAGVSLRDVQIAARLADPKTTIR